MKTIKIMPGPLSGTIHPVCSKSIAHRMLICAALSKKPTLLTISEGVQDIEATIGCLCALGAKIIFTDGLCHITPIGDNLPHKAVLDCKESGTTLRFLLPIVAALGVEATFIGEGRLPARPLADLLQTLKENGMVISSETLPLTVTGKLQGSNFCLPGNISSQYISGFLLALPLLGRQSHLQLSTDLESGGYVDLTIDILHKFGVLIAQDGSTYSCKNTPYAFCINPQIEADWSAAAFFLAAGALSAPVHCAGLLKESVQSDSMVYALLQQYGATASFADGICAARPCGRNPLAVDMRQIPDLLPILAVLAAGVKGQSLFHHAQRLAFKESNRLQAITGLINNLGGDACCTEDSLIVNGTGHLTGGTVDSMGDHRIAMTGAIAAVLCTEPVYIKNAAVVNKSYPDFYEDYKSLGGQLYVI